jgi:hypothetical protein
MNWIKSYCPAKCLNITRLLGSRKLWYRISLDDLFIRSLRDFRFCCHLYSLLSTARSCQATLCGHACKGLLWIVRYFWSFKVAVGSFRMNCFSLTSSKLTFLFCWKDYFGQSFNSKFIVDCFFAISELVLFRNCFMTYLMLLATFSYFYHLMIFSSKIVCWNSLNFCYFIIFV